MTNKKAIQQSNLQDALKAKGFDLTFSVCGAFVDESAMASPEGFPRGIKGLMEAREIVRSFGFSFDPNTDAIIQNT